MFLANFEACAKLTHEYSHAGCNCSTRMGNKDVQHGLILSNKYM